jgi:hypothetical protein
MERLATLSNDVATHMQSISGAVEQQRVGIEDMFSRLKEATEAVRTMGEDAQAMTGATFQLSELTEETFQHFAGWTPAASSIAALSARARALEPLRAHLREGDRLGPVSLADVLATDYREISGPRSPPWGTSST